MPIEELQLTHHYQVTLSLNPAKILFLDVHLEHLKSDQQLIH